MLLVLAVSTCLAPPSLSAVNLQTNNTWSGCRWEAKDVSKVRIERNEDPSVFDRKISYFAVRLSCQPSFGNGESITPVFSEDDRVLWGKILIRKKLHEARTISLLANPAAYFDPAVM